MSQAPDMSRMPGDSEMEMSSSHSSPKLKQQASARAFGAKGTGAQLKLMDLS